MCTPTKGALEPGVRRVLCPSQNQKSVVFHRKCPKHEPAQAAPVPAIAPTSRAWRGDPISNPTAHTSCAQRLRKEQEMLSSQGPAPAWPWGDPGLSRRGCFRTERGHPAIFPSQSIAGGAGWESKAVWTWSSIPPGPKPHVAGSILLQSGCSDKSKANPAVQGKYFLRRPWERELGLLEQQQAHEAVCGAKKPPRTQCQGAELRGPGTPGVLGVLVPGV